MISWTVYDQSNIHMFSSDGARPASKDYPNIDRDYFQQYGRTVGDNEYDVFIWNPCQQLLLTDSLQVKEAGSTKKYSADQFWKQVPQIINEYIQPLHPSLLKSDYIIQIFDHPVDLRAFIGYYGYLSFELSRHVEQYTKRDDDLPYPSLILDFPSKLLLRHQLYSIYIELDLKIIENPKIYLEDNKQPVTGIINHSTGYSTYINDLETIIQHIKQGDIYQANYTQQFMTDVPDLDLSELFAKIKKNQHLPHAALLKYSSSFCIFSLSPELFLHISEGHVRTKPIKGTRSRGQTPEEDQAMIDELVASTKDQAELAMIVDLLRNDLGKSALPGSVEVEAHAKVESYENVHHLVSTVTAEIQPYLPSSWNLLLRAFPGGSISGVPKLRSLEIIESLEKVPRGIYTGNIGFIGLNGDMEFNIAIRTAIQTKSSVVFNAGGGIVLDSNPVEEYIESLHKAKHIAQYLGHSFVGHIIYYNGEFVTTDRVQPHPTENGVFETILIRDGIPLRWNYHISRLKQGIDAYQLIDLTLPDADNVQQLLQLNLATDGLIRLNIYVWSTLSSGDEGSKNSIQETSHILVKVQPYPSPAPPFTLQLNSTSINPPTSIQQGLKSLNYSLYRDAIQSATAKNMWDTLLYTENDRVLEGGRSTIYYFMDNQWYTPETGVVAGTIRQLLLDNNMVKLRDITLNELFSVSSIAVSNALIEIRLISTIVDSDDQVWIDPNPGLSNSLLKSLQDVIDEHQSI